MEAPGESKRNTFRLSLAERVPVCVMLIACRSGPMPSATAAPSSRPPRSWSSAMAPSACGLLGDVARRAGVGPGTVYRSFGSKRELLLGLVDDRERELQEELLRGAPPLGPGRAGRRAAAGVLRRAPQPRDRAAVRARGGRRGRADDPLRDRAYAAWRRHVALLVAELLPREAPTPRCSPTCCSRRSPRACSSILVDERSSPRASCTRQLIGPRRGSGLRSAASAA